MECRARFVGSPLRLTLGSKSESPCSSSRSLSSGSELYALFGTRATRFASMAEPVLLRRVTAVWVNGIFSIATVLRLFSVRDTISSAGTSRYVQRSRTSSSRKRVLECADF